jgi:hypothetical protein
MIFYGVDGGASGGVAAYNDDTRTLYYFSFKESPTDAVDFVHEIGSGIVYIEKQTYAQGGRKNEEGEFVRKSSPRAMGVLGQWTGFALGIFMAEKCQVVQVPSRTWMSKMIPPKMYQKGRLNCYKGKAWKNYLKAVAQEKYPKAKITLETADAFLIMTYAYQMTTGKSLPYVEHYVKLKG